MPWKETDRMEERKAFIEAVLCNEEPMSSICERFGISRKTGYKWYDRFLKEGEGGLSDRSRAPREPPHAVSEEAVGAIVELRRKFPFWGPRKLKAWLEEHRGDVDWPAASTIGEVLKRNDLVRSRRQRRRVPPFSEPFAECDEPNRVWCADYKGQFRVNGQYCFPLTVSDAYSRYLLCCQGVEGTKSAPAQKIFERTFREYGLPERIRTDNGSPFASQGIAGLSRLSIWWIKLGILPERIEPGKPQQNGRHERMHRTLKNQVARRPRGSKRAQQKAFDRFRREYNELRPHEALDQTPPAQHYKRSPRPYAPPCDPEYPDHFDVRLANSTGDFHFRGSCFHLSRPLEGEVVGVEPFTDGRWTVWFGPILLGSLIEQGRQTIEFFPHTPQRK